jgi:hypothetical protein
LAFVQISDIVTLDAMRVSGAAMADYAALIRPTGYGLGKPKLMLVTDRRSE